MTVTRRFRQNRLMIISFKGMPRSMQVLLTVAGLAFAASAQAGYDQDPRAQKLYEQLRTEEGFSDADIARVRKALAQAQRIPSLVEAEQKAPERTENWSTYASKRVDPQRIHKGVAFIRANWKWLDKAEEQYGVPPTIVAGVIGLETNYGAFSGRARVLDALATQGFDHPTRSSFFFSELEQFFVMCRNTGRDPTQPLGSYAGAMGWAQFMPSNYLRLAVDFDGDGKKDLWSAPDAIGSVARYLTEYDPQRDWHRGEPVAIPVPAPALRPGIEIATNSKMANMTARDLEPLGIHSPVKLPPDMPVGLVELDLDQGKEYWLGFNNFYAIMSYNPRIYYAMTVTQLADGMEKELAASGGVEGQP